MKTAMILFPGQGSQCPGMGRDVAERDAECMDLWKKAEQKSGLPLREIYWEGDEAAMSSTKALQPALTVVNCSLWKQVAGKVDPLGAAGHSLGEFSALACAHALDMEDVLEATCVRGALMDQADPNHTGGMVAAVKIDAATLAEIVTSVQNETNEMLLCANFNTPQQTVLSGTQKALQRASALIKEQKGRAVPLKVSAAFHSPLMQEANTEFGRVLSKLTWHTARFPVYGNIDGCPERDGARLCEKVRNQMVSPVRFVDTVCRQYADGARAWLEVGPKSILSKMVSQCLPSPEEAITTHAVTDAKSAAEL